MRVQYHWCLSSLPQNTIWCAMMYIIWYVNCFVVFCFVCVIYRQFTNIRRTKSQLLKDYRTVLRSIFAESLEARCHVENEDVVGASTSEWSTILLPIKVSYIRDFTVVSFMRITCFLPWSLDHLAGTGETHDCPNASEVIPYHLLTNNRQLPIKTITKQELST